MPYEMLEQVTKEFNDAMSSWLDSESHYRLTVEQAKEDGAKFASNGYAKWKTVRVRIVCVYIRVCAMFVRDVMR